MYLKCLFPFWIEMAVPIFMIISGYVYSLSYKRSGIKQIEDAYLPQNIINKLIRYTIPYAIIFIIEELFYVLTGTLSLSSESAFSAGLRFLSGGKGPGSYYYPVMMQFAFVFPIIFLLLRSISLREL